MVDEVRRQFREMPGILAGTAKPDYKTCIEISSRGAIGEMKIPALLAVIVPVLCGFIFGPEFVGGIIDWIYNLCYHAGYFYRKCRWRMGQCQKVY